MSAPVSVVIPTRNAGPEFRRTLHMIRQQENVGPVEIVVVDSASTDETLDLCRQFDVTVHPIAPAQFNHGATRNFGIAQTRHDFVVLTVQDAVPVDSHWLSSLVENLRRYPRVAGVYSRQVPRADCDPFTRHQLETWWTGASEWRLQQVEDWLAFRRLDPLQQQALATFDNVSSALRREAWREVPFRPLRFGEDIDWGLRVLRQGWGIVYEPASAVIHSHDRSAWYELKRHYVCHKTLKELFGTQTVPGLLRIPRNVCGELRCRWAFLRQQGLRQQRLFWRALALSVGNQVGQYLGGKADRLLARCGRWYGRVDRFLSRGV